MKRFVLFVCIVCLWLTGCAIPPDSDTIGVVTDITRAKTPPSAARPTQPTHTVCRYCGEQEGDSRWFIARVMENGMVMPLGTDCFEATSAMDAGISLHYSAVDGEAGRRLAAGEIVRITYNGLIMETYPVQIRADSVTVETELETDAETVGETETLNVLEEDGKRYLVLPVSGDKVRLSNHELAYIDDIDPALLKAAEEKITGQISQYGDNSGLYLGVVDGHLCLCSEVIVKINPPRPSEYGNSGCGIDHDHKFFSERITK